MKRILAFVLCLAMIGLAVGCINTQQPAETTAAAPAKTTAAPDGAPTEGGTDKTEGPSTDGKTVKIGVIGAISGVNSESGRQAVLAAEIAEEYINSKGGIKSMGGAKVETVKIDSTSDASTAALPVERALSQGGIAGLAGSAQSAITLTILPILQKYKVPAVTGSAANSTITEKGCEYVFQPAATADTFATIQIDFLRYLAEKLGKDIQDLKIGLVYENSAWGEDNAKNTRTQLEAAGLKLAVDENYQAGALSDASPIVTKLMNAGVDVLFPSSYANDAKLILTAAKSMNYGPIIVAGGSAFTWPSLLNDLGELVNGITSADGFVNDQKNAMSVPEFVEITEMYEKKNKEFIPGQGGPMIVSYMMVYEAIERAGSDDPVKVREELLKMNAENSTWFKVLNGKGEFNANGKNIGAKPIMLQWQNNRPTAVYPEEFATNELLNPLTLKPFE